MLAVIQRLSLSPTNMQPSSGDDSPACVGWLKGIEVLTWPVLLPFSCCQVEPAKGYQWHSRLSISSSSSCRACILQGRAGVLQGGGAALAPSLC